MLARLALFALAALIFAQPAGAITGEKPEFKQVADGVYAYIGKLNDANALAIVTREGVVLVDTGNNTTDSREIARQLRAVTDQPIRYVVISQNHGDHVGGTPLFSPNATVIVHERVAKLWAAMKPYQIASWRKRFAERASVLANFNPIDTVVAFNDRMTLHLGGRDIELIYVDDLHNPGDVAVWLPKERVLHGGFAAYKDRHPDICPDYSHGTTAGMLKQLYAYIALKPLVVVPAHGPLSDVKDLQVMVDYLLLARKKVGAMMDRGLALPAIEREFHMNEFVAWDRKEHFNWMAGTIHRELRGEGPLEVRYQQKQVSGTITRVVLDGRQVFVKTSDGSELQLRVTGDTDVQGIADRTEVRPGMNLSALYHIPEGVAASLGYDALEVKVSP